MQKKLMKALDDIREQEIDLKETPVLFRWTYPEEPWIEFELMIRELDQASLPLTEELH